MYDALDIALPEMFATLISSLHELFAALIVSCTNSFAILKIRELLVALRIDVLQYSEDWIIFQSETTKQIITLENCHVPFSTLVLGTEPCSLFVLS